MGNKLIVGNIKMNMRFGEISNYLNQFKNVNNKNLVICPSYIYIPYFLNYNFSVGSQNVCSFDVGYTGEISARQLSSIGVKYVMVGHSERRIKLNESDIDINNKIRASLHAKMKVILCIGETLEEFKLLKKDSVIKRQIRDSLFNVSDLSNVIIAYEPVWAIGTNKVPSIEDITSTVIYIKQLVKQMYKQDIKVIYGGSINEKNIVNLNKIDILDGFLIGGASINPNQFLEIIEKIS